MVETTDVQAAVDGTRTTTIMERRVAVLYHHGGAGQSGQVGRSLPLVKLATRSGSLRSTAATSRPSRTNP